LEFGRAENPRRRERGGGKREGMTAIRYVLMETKKASGT